MSEAPRHLPTSISLAIIFTALVAVALGLFVYFCKVAIHEALSFVIGPG